MTRLILGLIILVFQVHAYANVKENLQLEGFLKRVSVPVAKRVSVSAVIKQIKRTTPFDDFLVSRGMLLGLGVNLKGRLAGMKLRGNKLYIGGKLKLVFEEHSIKFSGGVAHLDGSTSQLLSKFMIKYKRGHRLTQREHQEIIAFWYFSSQLIDRQNSLERQQRVEFSKLRRLKLSGWCESPQHKKKKICQKAARI